MAYFKSEAWQEILTTADQWRDKVVFYLDDLTSASPPIVAAETQTLLRLVSANSTIDPTPFLEVDQELDIRRQLASPLVCQVNQGRIIGADARASDAQLEKMVMRCCSIIDALRAQGIADDEPDVELAEVVFLGDGLYRTPSGDIKLDGAQAYTLAALVELRACTKAGLVKRSGVEDAPRVLNTIRRNFPQLAESIVMPGRKRKVATAQP